MIAPLPADRPRGRGWRANDLNPADIAPVLRRFISYFEPGGPDECWPWLGYRFHTGYGGLRSARSVLLAHRVSWVAFSGKPLTGNLTVDHLCRNKLCVNPGHLEPVTLSENVRRGNVQRGQGRAA